VEAIFPVDDDGELAGGADESQQLEQVALIALA